MNLQETDRVPAYDLLFNDAAIEYFAGRPAPAGTGSGEGLPGGIPTLVIYINATPGGIQDEKGKVGKDLVSQLLRLSQESEPGRAGAGQEADLREDSRRGQGKPFL